MKYVVHCSGGKTSFWALKCAIEQKGKENVFPLFADTKYEDADLYRFLTDQERLLGIDIIRVSDGRTPWGVFHDEGLINVRAYYPCSGKLKKEMIDGWIAANMHEPFVHVFGMNWHETNRMERLAKVYGEENIWFPLAEKPYMENDDITAYLTSVGIAEPYLYTLGFDHNNCGGRCVKAGIGHWKKVLELLPDRYNEVALEEQAFQQHIGKNVTILKDRSKGQFKPMSLIELREKVHAKPSFGGNEIEGGCGCYVASILDELDYGS